MTFRRIVCGVDGSVAGFEALRQARRLLGPEGRLVAVTVVEERIAVHTGMFAATALDDLRADADSAKQAAAELLHGLGGAEAIVTAGRPADVLRSVAVRERADLVAVGTHGQSRRAGILVGSVATAMLHDAPCSVLVARPIMTSAAFPTAIVAAVDGSRASAEVVAVATALADRLGASLRVIAATGGKVDLEAAQSMAGDIDVDSRPPLEALEKAASEADLIVVGSRGLHGVRALGSVSERIAHRAACSVLIVRPLKTDPARPSL
jgi:nucleotide-binding universal stress UspA family protein